MFASATRTDEEVSLGGEPEETAAADALQSIKGRAASKYAALRFALSNDMLIPMQWR